MARISDFDCTQVYETAELWKEKCLVEGDSLLWPGHKVWSKQSFEDFKKHFIDAQDNSKDSFEQKFERQLDPALENTTRLACEILLVYFLFTSGVGEERKKGLITEVASWKDLQVDFDRLPPDCLRHGIGNPGIAYNTRRPSELEFIAKLAILLESKPLEERIETLSNDIKFRHILDAMCEETRFQSRDIILHLLFPDKYERIASSGHKRLIGDAFKEILDSAAPEDLDDRLFSIRQKLETLLPDSELDFYWPPLIKCWYEENETSELTPIEGLTIKRQIVFYGPPGTGKTHDAKELADLFIRQSILRNWGPKKYFSEVSKVEEAVKKRMGRIQFHPAYGYEDLIRGIQISDKGSTEYREGVLLKILNQMKGAPPEIRELPYVLILDEMNRADLSKVLGECFSLMEDRDSSVRLSGQDDEPFELRLPQNLHFIGTMNLIDQSLEQVDFALRRRFLWFFKGYSSEGFLAVARKRWEELHNSGNLKKPWTRFEEEFNALAKRAQNLNVLIEKDNYLGSQYQIGHTYFCDVVAFAQKFLSVSPGRQTLLFSLNGDAREPVNSLWKFSIAPLLDQYLSGVELSEKKSFLEKARQTFCDGV